MKNKLKLIILFVAVWNCNGHLRILGDILSSAHDRIHSTVENAAGTLLGGISHGLNFNAGGHFGVNGNKQQPSRPDETIVVVIKEEDNNNNFRPPNPNFRPPHHNNGFGPNQDPFRPNNPRPNYNVPNNGNNFVNRPNYGNRYPDNQYNGNQNNYNPNYNQGGNNYGPPPNKYPQNNYNNGQNNNYNDNNNANNYNNNNNKPVDPGYNQVPPITNHNNKRPGVPEESPTEYQTKKPDYDVTTTKPVEDDAPLFIPLNDYNYGGDKINITAPKRDTNSNNKAEEEDEDFGIDVRIKDT